MAVVGNWRSAREPQSGFCGCGDRGAWPTRVSALREAGEALAEEGYLLEEDIEPIAQRSAKIWDAFTS